MHHKYYADIRGNLLTLLSAAYLRRSARRRALIWGERQKPLTSVGLAMATIAAASRSSTWISLVAICKVSSVRQLIESEPLWSKRGRKRGGRPLAFLLFFLLTCMSSAAPPAEALVDADVQSITARLAQCGRPEDLARVYSYDLGRRFFACNAFAKAAQYLTVSASIHHTISHTIFGAMPSIRFLLRPYLLIFAFWF